MFGLRLGKMGLSSAQTFNKMAQAILRSFGSSASSYPFSTRQGAFQTFAGPAATVVTDPIGLELDAMGAVGPELSSALDGTWTRDATVSNIGATMVAVGLGGAANGFYKSIGASGAGNTFLITVVCSSYTSGQITAWLGAQQSANSNAFISGAGTLQFYVTATGVANGFVIIGSNAAGASWTVSSVSCVQVTGNHATQTTAINRPTLQRGLWNFLAQSSNLASGDWIAASSGTYTVNSGATPGPYSGTVADVLTASPTGLVYVTNTPNLPAGKFTEAVWVKLISGSGSVTLNVSGTTDGGTALTSSWQLVVFACPTDFVAGFKQISFILPNSAVVAVYSAGLFQGTLTAQQILAQGGIPLTTSAAGSNPTAGPFWASFNGTNSSLALTTVPFQMADDFAVVACVQNGTPLAWSPIFSVAGAAAVPRIELFVDNASGHAAAYFRDDASANVLIQGAADIRNVSTVVTIAKRGTSVFLRVNGVQVATGSVAAFGAATMTAASIGAVPFVGEWFIGGIYDIDPIKGTVTDAQLLTLEKAAGQRAGLVI